MKKKTKKQILIGSLILIGILLFLNFTGFLSQLYPSSGTLYNSWSVDLDKLELTYSDTSTQDLRAHAFKPLHSLTGELSNDFSSGELNKRFWRFFLKANNVNPDNFRDYSGRVLSGVFTPINWESLASRVWDESDGAYKYVAYSPVGEDIEKIKSLGFSWDYRGCWSGGYKTSIMQDMANKMACYVEGYTTALANDIYIKPDRSQSFSQKYKIFGDASFDGDSFRCQVDTNELFEDLPKTFIRPSDGATVSVGGAGVDGKVVFYFGEKKYKVYSLKNNECSYSELELAEITPKDYTSREECEQHILKQFYRLENRKCNIVQVSEFDRQSNDYVELLLCQNDLLLSLEDDFENMGIIINDLELTLQEKINLIESLTENIKEQSIIISQLQLTLQEKVTMVESLSKNIEEQAILINSLEEESSQQILIINELNLNIQEQAEMINQLTENLQIKADLVSQLQVTNEEQANLISQMKLSFSDQAEIINQLNKVISDDAEIIQNLNLNLNDQSILIDELNLSNIDMANLIDNLNLNIQEQAELINNLQLTINQERELVSQLYNTIYEQNLLLEELQKYKDTPSYIHFWNQYKIYIILISLLILLIIGGLFYKKRN